MARVANLDHLLLEGLGRVARGEEGGLDAVLLEHAQNAVEADRRPEYAPRDIGCVGWGRRSQAGRVDPRIAGRCQLVPRLIWRLAS